MGEIETKLHKALAVLTPTFISLENESHQHAGYFVGKESHFKLVIVSPAFDNKRLVARHQQVYALVNDRLGQNGGTIHALAIHAYSQNEWATLSSAPTSPACAGAR